MSGSYVDLAIKHIAPVPPHACPTERLSMLFSPPSPCGSELAYEQ